MACVKQHLLRIILHDKVSGFPFNYLVSCRQSSPQHLQQNVWFRRNRTGALVTLVIYFISIQFLIIISHLCCGDNSILFIFEHSWEDTISSWKNGLLNQRKISSEFCLTLEVAGISKRWGRSKGCRKRCKWTAMTRVGGGRYSTLGFWRFANTSSTTFEGSVYRSPLSRDTQHVNSDSSHLGSGITGIISLSIIF